MSEETRRNLPRVLLLLAAVGYIVCTFLPWAVGEAVGRPTQYSAYQGGEGVWLVIFAAALAAMGVFGMLTEATSRTLQLLPGIIAVAAAVMWIGANQEAQYEITFWLNQLGTGDFTWVRWLAAVAIVANVVAWLLYERWRSDDVRKRTQPITRELGINRWSVATLIVAILLGTGGGMLALYLVITEWGAKASIIGLIAAVIGLFLGAAIGVRLVRWFRATTTHAA